MWLILGTFITLLLGARWALMCRLLGGCFRVHILYVNARPTISAPFIRYHEALWMFHDTTQGTECRIVWHPRVGSRAGSVVLRLKLQNPYRRKHA